MAGFRGKIKMMEINSNLFSRYLFVHLFLKKDDQPVGGIFFPKPRLQKTSLPQTKTAENPMEYIYIYEYP